MRQKNDLHTLLPAMRCAVAAFSLRRTWLTAGLTGCAFIAVLATAWLTSADAMTQKPQRAARRVTKAPKGKGAAVQTSRPSQVLSESRTNADGTITPGQILTDFPVQRMTVQIMEEQAQRPAQAQTLRPEFELEEPGRKDLPSAPGAINASQWPLPDKTTNSTPILNSPQTPSTQFNGATGPTETGAFPPDSNGAVGPTQYVVFLNGRLRSFNKTTGVADGVLDADTDVFFSSVMTPAGAGQTTFTTDPNVRFDRLSNRWFLNMIDATVVSSTGAIAVPNRVLIAVSDATSNGVISASTTWSFYQFQGDATLFTDYQSFGIDASAMYIGGNMFTLAGAFNSTKGFVIPKAPVLTGTALSAYAFNGMVATSTSAGPFSPRGVDNYDTTNTGAGALGYFIGVDNASFSLLSIRRVTNPGAISGAPTMSANITVTVPTTAFPINVPHLGNTGGTNGNLDGLDDRLFAAHLRNGRLWTAHNIKVNSSGVGASAGDRNGSRWYELQNLSTTPTLVQSGTLYDNAASTPRSYWIPAIMVSGQGHAALGCSIAGTNERINAFTTGRLAGDTLGTLREGPGGSSLPGYTTSSTAYNPTGDTGAGNGSRRWGDYSYTSLDPCDDMTMWTIQQYCNGTNTYGVRVVKLLAPPPATPASASVATVADGQASVNITITGTQVGGSGFYDPGAGFCSRLSATVSGGVTVNSVTYINPTQVTLNISTVGASVGAKNVTITNPDGQSLTGNSLFSVTSSSCTVTSLTPNAKTVGAKGGSFSFSVAAPSCAWTAVSQAAWITVTSNASGTGNQVVGYTVAPNTTGAQRMGTITVNNLTFTVTQRQRNATTTGVFRPSNGNLYLKNQNTTGFADLTLVYGQPGDLPITGDWDGDGIDTIGIYRNGTFYLRNSNTTGFADIVITFGAAGDQPVAGDWNGDGIDTIGVYRNGTYYLRNSLSTGTPDITLTFGAAGDVPITGDWNGDGIDTIGVFRPTNGNLYLRNTNTTGIADILAVYGAPGDQPVVGDWDGNGTDTIGVKRGQNFYLRNSNSTGFADIVFTLGLTADLPIAGDWDGLP